MEARTNETTNASGSYVHGVIGAGIHVPEVAALPTLRGVSDGELQALVSTVELEQWTNEALSSREAVAERARLHEAALEPLLPSCTPLPMRLGTILPSDEEVRTLLRRARPLLIEAMAATDGRREWGIKLLVDRSAVAHQVQQQDRELQSLEQRIEQAAEGTRYMLEKRREREISNLVDAEGVRLARLVREERDRGQSGGTGRARRLRPERLPAAVARARSDAHRTGGKSQSPPRGPGHRTPVRPYSFAPQIRVGEEQAELVR